MKTSNENSVKRVPTSTLKVAFRVSYVNHENRTCKLQVRFSNSNTGEIYSEEEMRVGISVLMSERIQNAPDVYKTKVWLESSIDSKDFKENPYQLIRFMNESGEPEYYMATVDQRKAKATYMGETPDGRSIYSYQNRKHSMAYYRRYRDAYGRKVRFQQKEQEKAAQSA